MGETSRGKWEHLSRGQKLANELFAEGSTECQRAANRQNIIKEPEIIRVAQRVIPKSTRHMDEQERIDGTRQMIRDLEKLASRDGCIAAAWALDFIRTVTRT